MSRYTTLNSELTHDEETSLLDTQPCAHIEVGMPQLDIKKEAFSSVPTYNSPHYRESSKPFSIRFVEIDDVNLEHEGLEMTGHCGMACCLGTHFLIIGMACTPYISLCFIPLFKNRNTKTAIAAGSAAATLLFGILLEFACTLYFIKAGWIDNMGRHCQKGSLGWEFYKQSGHTNQTCFDYYHSNWVLPFHYIGIFHIFASLLLCYLSYRINKKTIQYDSLTLNEN